MRHKAAIREEWDPYPDLTWIKSVLCVTVGVFLCLSVYFAVCNAFSILMTWSARFGRPVGRVGSWFLWFSFSWYRDSVFLRFCGIRAVRCPQWLLRSLALYRVISSFPLSDSDLSSDSSVFSLWPSSLCRSLSSSWPLSCLVDLVCLY